jgi:hypothetical protein
MKITLTPQEAEEIFFNSMCNAIGTNYMRGYGIELAYNREEYQTAKSKLLKKASDNYTKTASVCYEEVLMEILREGGKLTFIDHEGEGCMTRDVTLENVHKRMENVPASTIMNFVQQEDDAEDADVVLQTIFFEEIVFG